MFLCFAFKVRLGFRLQNEKKKSMCKFLARLFFPGWLVGFFIPDIRETMNQFEISNISQPEEMHSQVS